jgi:hypothetical protein
MRNRDRAALITAAALAFLFAAVIVVMILLRAETTYNYPPYSSLNNSADGTKAYFETLGRLGFTATRNYRPLRKLKGAQADIFFPGIGLEALRHADEKDFEDFEELAKSGTRLIIATQPESVWAAAPVPSKGKKPAPPPKDLLKERWGIEIGFRERPGTRIESGTFKRLGIKPVTGFFQKWSKEWSPSLERADAPLFLERSFGKGSVLLISDCRYFTNRVLLTHPDMQVLTAVPGAHSAMIFDESHLGLEDTGTVVGLATSHHLNWVLLGFAVLAALYIWRNSVSFVPPVAISKDHSVAGQDAYAALTNLLMQSVPAKDLLHKAAQEWNSTAYLRRKGRTIRPEELALLPDLDATTSLAEYKSLSERLNHTVSAITVK